MHPDGEAAIGERTMTPPFRTTRRGVVALGAGFGAGLLAAAFAPRPGARAQGTGVPARIVGAFDALCAGPHPGRRTVHAPGVLCEGAFTPAPGAALSRAAHLQGAPVPVLARFSNFAAVPGLPDGDPAANPRGLAIKFFLLDEGDTDIVAHSYDGFPTGTPEDFLAFLRAVPDPAALAAHPAAHPAARAFVEHPKPTPASYATERISASAPCAPPTPPAVPGTGATASCPWPAHPTWAPKKRPGARRTSWPTNWPNGCGEALSPSA